MAQLSCLVVVGEHMMVVVPAFTQCCHRDCKVLHWADMSAQVTFKNSKLLRFWTFSIIMYSRKQKTRPFRNWISFQRSQLNRCLYLPLTWGQKQIQFPNCSVFYFREYGMMKKVQNPSKSECYVIIKTLQNQH